MIDINKALEFFEDKLPELAVNTLNSPYEDDTLNLSEDEQFAKEHIQFNRYRGDKSILPFRYITWSWSEIETYAPIARSSSGVRRKPSTIQSIEFSLGLYMLDDKDNPVMSAKRFRHDYFRLAQAIDDTLLFQLSYTPPNYNPDIKYHFAGLNLVSV